MTQILAEICHSISQNIKVLKIVTNFSFVSGARDQRQETPEITLVGLQHPQQIQRRAGATFRS